MIKLAIVGCGGHSEKEHAAPLAHYAAEHPDEVSMAAACDLRGEWAERFCREYGFARPYDDVNKMLDAESLDGCITVMPISKIVDMAEVMLRRGMPCVIEKPPGATLDAARLLADVAEETGTPHMVSVNRRFWPTLNQAIDWAGKAGPLRYVRGTMLRKARTEPDFLWGTGIHAVDAMRHIGGNVVEYHAAACRPPDVSGVWHILSFRFESGATGQLEILPSAGKTDERYELFGENFVACASTDQWKNNRVQCWRDSQLEMDIKADSEEPPFVSTGAYHEAAAFISALRGDASFGPTMADVLPSLEICSEIA